MPKQTSGNIAATGNSNAVTLTFTRPDVNFYVGFSPGLTGAWTGATVQVEGLDPSGTWVPVAVKDLSTGLVNNGGTAFSLTDSTNKGIAGDCGYFQKVRVWLAALSTGDVNVVIESDNYGVGQFVPSFLQATTGSAITAPATITGTNANVFDVGQNGQTNPAIQVDTSTASSATGLKFKSAAAGGGFAVSVISSGTNENLTENAKGAGQIIIGGTSTGQVSIGRGSVAPPILSNTISALGTAQSSTPTAVQICGGVVTQTSSTGAGTVTLPTGTAIETQLTANGGAALANGDSFCTTFANLGGGQTLTITTSTGLTLVGTAAVSSGKICTMEFVRTGANTWTVYLGASA